MTDKIRLINVLFRGGSHYGKHSDCKNRKLYDVSTIFFKGRMLCKDISCVFISMQPPHRFRCWDFV